MSMYISFDELRDYGMIERCQAALSAAGKAYFWDADLIIDKGRCFEASWGGRVSGGVTFPMPQDFPAMIRAGEARKAAAQAAAREAGEREKAVYARLSNLPAAFERGGLKFQIAFQRFGNPEVWCSFAGTGLRSCYFDEIGANLDPDQMVREACGFGQGFEYVGLSVFTAEAPADRPEGWSDQELCGAIVAAADRVLAAMEKAQERCGCGCGSDRKFDPVSGFRLDRDEE